MKQYFFVLMIVIISAETVDPTSNQCSCDIIKSQADCKAVSQCAWTPGIEATSTSVAIIGLCGVKITPITPTAALTHCQQVTATNCWKTLGCAYVDSQCTHFTGCTAYVKITNSDCQAISNQCITDGTQCTDAKACHDYNTESECTTSSSSSGILKCKWENNACRNYFCTEADTTLSTNTACDTWLPGCLTTGKGCIATLGACASYAGDDVACSGLKGTDWNCEGTFGGTNCTARICSQAATTLSTDTDCDLYQKGCITTGKGCVASSLSACATYSGDNTTCLGYIGSDGVCVGDAGATNCRSTMCKNAPVSDTTDVLCTAYKTGCVTTGKGCATSKSNCSAYSGTITSCVGYIGSDGYCKGTNATTDSQCSPMACSDAPINTSTDTACIAYQFGCKSTGKGCVNALGLCSSYSGTKMTCEGYIGSDGKCKGTQTDVSSACSPKVCTEAPTSTTTQEACASYQTGCVTTGDGCIAPIGCLATIKQLTCVGTDGCGWNSICVSSQNCSDFKTTSICNENNAILVSGSTTTTTPCFWTGSVCRNLACTDALNTINSDSLCNTFLSGCLTKGDGCLAPTTSCLYYQGTRAICSAFTKRCYNIEGASTTTACAERVCSDDISSTTDFDCNSFKTDCRTKGIGCIDPSKLCSDYSGLQLVCDAFKGNNGLTRCWALSTSTLSTCIDKTCAHKASANSNQDCEAFLSGCLFSGVGCVTKSQPCSAFTGTQSQCNNFRANNGADTCWNTSITISGGCIVKNCSHSGALTSDGDCKMFLENCLTTGSGCIINTAPCSSYMGTLSECDTFTGNSLRCFNKNYCADRVCTDKSSGVSNNTECTDYLASCRYFNGGCVTKNICTGYAGDTLAKCSEVLDNSLTPKKCWWVTGGTSCIARTCGNVLNTSSQQNCTDHLATCVFNGSICVESGNCNSYPAFGIGLAVKQTNCGAMKNSASKYCWNSEGTLCEERTCSNVPFPYLKLSCDNHIGDSISCQYNGSTCVVTNVCSNYIPIGSSDQAKITICQAMTDTSDTPITCFFITGATYCVSKSCSNAPIPTSQSSCDSHLSGKCGWNGTACVNLGNCNSYSLTGGTDATKKSICEALINVDSIPKKCTFNSGGSTCIDRTCLNIMSPTSSSDCIQWLASCKWNGQNCAESTPTVCTSRVCTSIFSPSGLSDCTNFSSTCRWSGIGSCEEANNCTSYTVVALTGASQCATLTDTSGAICGYTTSTTCTVPVCSNKTNAINQADCTTQGVGCRYVGLGTCVNAAACTYSVTGITGDSARKIACENATDTSGTIKCAFIPGGVLCNPRGACPGYYATSYAICSQVVDTDGISCNYTSATTCRASVCADKVDASNLTDCTNFLTKCRYVGVGTCLTEAACAYDVSTVGSDSAKKTLCESLTDSHGVHCSFIPAATTCTPRLACTSYAGSSIGICNQIYDENGNKCSFTGGVICAIGSCTSKNDAANKSDCSIQGDGCRYIGVSTCAPAGICTSYSVSGLFDSVKLSVCDSLTNTGGLFCTWVAGTAGTCVARDCTNIISPTSNSDCNAWLGTCTYTGTGCITKAVCGDYTPTGSGNTAKRSYCAAILDNSSPQVQCGYTDNAAKCESRSCTNCGPLTSQTACKAWLNTCTYNGVACLIAAACNSYSLSTFSNANTNIGYYTQCRAIKNDIGDGCDLSVKTCGSITPTPTSSQDCINWMSNCRFTGNTCIEAVACAYTLTGDYATSAKSNSEKIALCNSLEDNTNSTPKIYCTLTSPIASGTVCIARTCSNIDPFPTSQDNCINWLSICTYNGTTCVTTTACSSYNSIGSNDATRGPQCKSMKNTLGDLCGFVSGTGQTTCIDRACNNAPTPSSDNDCSGYKSSCTISNASTAICIEADSSCTLFSGLPTHCQSQLGNSLKCWSALGAPTSTPSACKLRECTDNTTFTTNDQCNTFLSGCKTSGVGCVVNAINCSTFLGNISTCINFKASDGTSFCKVGITQSDACKDKACTDDGTSTSNTECQQFKDGCLTNGQGCIASTEPCTRYQGTQSICSRFVGNNQKCWNPSSVTIATTYCVDKKCSDDNTSITDTACNSSLSDCVTKGTGCIEKTAGCGSYQGLQSTCSAFKGQSGTKLCWNDAGATITTSCVDKVCTHNSTATLDTECEAFLPRTSSAMIPQCVASRIGCVTYPRSCSGFTGTLEQCGKFTATDGPCKTTATGNITASGACTPRICTEALNTLNTDALCFTFHPTCVTTGYGCATSVSCISIQERFSCSAKIGCSWVSNCRSIGAACSSLESSGASICVNTPVSSGSKKCSWYNGSTCRTQTCDDLPATFISHDSCSAAIATCTTTGTGCITMVACSAYPTEVICKAAKTTNSGGTCIWDNNACRAKKCTDAIVGATTDAGCNTYLAGCKTNGASCVVNITCSTLLTALACQVDENGKPCLYVNDLCYSYAKCEDAFMTTHSDCQKFSSLCTTDGGKCIAITTCAKTVNYISCVIGIDGICGWLPANGANASQCQKFGTCSDATAIDITSCSAYGSNCITDGIKCIDKNICSNYLTQIACETNGTDGVCQFILSSSTCRLRECTDATTIIVSGDITTHSGCYEFSAKTKCTTNGTSCYEIQACASYIVEVGCVEGTDGLCIYALPVGQTTGAMACRVKVCGDFTLTTSSSCSIAITGVGLGTGCVSDGTTCIVKTTCATYAFKEACNGGGTDGQCAYTPGSTAPNFGTCQLMTACTDANNDSEACISNSQACAWQVSISNYITTTSCSAQTCATKASGSTCHPIPSYNFKRYTVCGPASGGECRESLGVSMLASTCQSYTMNTYTWDEINSKCVACFTTNIDPGNGGVVTPTIYGKIIKSMMTLVIMILLVI